jgi:predicted phage-related endonuclease
MYRMILSTGDLSMSITRETINYSTEAEWLAHREKDITSTEAAALFDAGSYEGARTFYELFHKKSGTLTPPKFIASDRIKWGSRLESAIAYGVAEDYGVIVVPFKNYMRIPELRLGASFDFRIIGLADGFSGDESVREMYREHGQGNLEVKNIDSLQFRRNWIEDGETIEATPQIELQTQAQMEVADLNWSLIAPLVGGNTPKVVIRLRDREVGAMIREKAADLWSRIESGNAPEPDYTKDADVISKLYVNNNGAEVDLSDNNRLIVLCAEHEAAKIAKNEAEKRQKAAKAEILTIIQHAKSVHAGAFKIGAGTNKESYRAYHKEAGERWTITRSVIPECDVEATVPAYRNVRIGAA